MTVCVDPVALEGLITENISLFGIDLYTENHELYLREDPPACLCETSFNAFDILGADATIGFSSTEVFGDVIGETSLGTYSEVREVHFSFHVPTGCLKGHGKIKVGCFDVERSFEICSGTLTTSAIGLLASLIPNPFDKRGGSATEHVLGSKLHIYDSFGNHVGLDSLGNLEIEIADAEFMIDEATGQQFIYIPGGDAEDGYDIYVEGLEGSQYDLAILTPNGATDSSYFAQYFEEMTEAGALHKLPLSATNDWKLLNDLDGDSLYESSSGPDSLSQAAVGDTPAIITNVQSHVQPPSEAVITWDTDVLSTSEVTYGMKDSPDARRLVDTAMVTSHSVVLDGLVYGEVYTYNVASVDSQGTYGTYVEKEFVFTWDYICGDADASGGVDIDDVVYLVAYIFGDGSEPIPYESGDADCSGGVDIDDVVYLVNRIFASGYEPCDIDGDGVPDC